MSQPESIRERLNQISQSVIGAAYEVSNHLGAGFLEKVYERALQEELRLKGIKVEAQAECPVTYKGCHVGHYLADLLVEDSVIVEIKCVDHILQVHEAQCLNYLKATGLHLALLLDFRRPKVRIKRVVNGF